MISVAVIDDDARYVATIRDYLTRYGEEAGVRFRIDGFADGEDIVERYGAGYDIVLMDVEMRSMDGMTAARRIRDVDSAVIIIFITNMAQYAIKGYQVDALDYVLKPISYFAFCQTIAKAVRRLSERRTDGGGRHLVINSRGNVSRVPLASVMWIDSKGHRVAYHTANGVFESTVSSMKELEEQLKDDDFYRCANSCLVNLAYVRSIQGSTVTVGGNTLEISRARRAGFVAALTSYAGRMV
ncbi:LytR/AlgR family response regulator transcription factor [Bifidobacterium aerophilum]|uniref:Response regulator n=1 Tax=Bifidobacterium aerophilum TaxID=1798155 RepID=A0A6N9Z4Z2_9BIFI|nr:LytTR family DNA-binding domain-containing protein [Bifidobacterium aerophilum]NEG89779.1 response regulator [Bifidobacterium aerophilum]